jgi:hypothetical protein
MVGVRVTFIAALAGELNVGATGIANGADVVKLLIADQALVPLVLVELTLQ